MDHTFLIIGDIYIYSNIIYIYIVTRYEFRPPGIIKNYGAQLLLNLMGIIKKRVLSS